MVPTCRHCSTERFRSLLNLCFSLSPSPFSQSLSLSPPELKAEHKRLGDGALLPGQWSLRKYERTVFFFYLFLLSFLVQLFILITSSCPIYPLPWNPRVLYIWGVTVRTINSFNFWEQMSTHQPNISTS